MRRINSMFLMLVTATCMNAEVKDLTSKIVNADFSKKLEGWTVKCNVAFEYITLESGYSACQNTNTFDISQTIEGLENGIYLVQMHGTYFLDYYVPIYKTWLYANENATPIMYPSEDILSESEAQDKVNCYLSGTESTRDLLDVNNRNLRPQSLIGATYAFQGGRYVNQIAVKVTDGRLVIGLKNYNKTSDHTFFSDFKLFFLGMNGEATESILQVTDKLIKRACFLRDNKRQETDFGLNLSIELDEVIEDLESRTGNWIMEDVNRLSKLMQDIQTIQDSYQEMYSFAKNLFDKLNIMANEDKLDWEEYCEFEAYYDSFMWAVARGELDLMEFKYKQMCESKAYQSFLNYETGISSIKSASDHSASSYDLQGRQIQQKPQKGIYIQGGKKILAK